MDSPLPALRELSPTIRYASYLLTAAALLLIVEIHLLPALLAGLLVFELVQAMVPLLGRRISGDRARVVVVAVLGTWLMTEPAALSSFSMRNGGRQDDTGRSRRFHSHAGCRLARREGQRSFPVVG